MGGVAPDVPLLLLLLLLAAAGRDPMRRRDQRSGAETAAERSSFRDQCFWPGKGGFGGGFGVDVL